jgi:hypothetical protein
MVLSTLNWMFLYVSLMECHCCQLSIITLKQSVKEKRPLETGDKRKHPECGR